MAGHLLIQLLISYVVLSGFILKGSIATKATKRLPPVTKCAQSHLYKSRVKDGVPRNIFKVTDEASCIYNCLEKKGCAVVQYDSHDGECEWYNEAGTFLESEDSNVYIVTSDCVIPNNSDYSLVYAREPSQTGSLLIVRSGGECMSACRDEPGCLATSYNTILRICQRYKFHPDLHLAPNASTVTYIKFNRLSVTTSMTKGVVNTSQATDTDMSIATYDVISKMQTTAMPLPLEGTTYVSETSEMSTSLTPETQPPGNQLSNSHTTPRRATHPASDSEETSAAPTTSRSPGCRIIRPNPQIQDFDIMAKLKVVPVRSRRTRGDNRVSAAVLGVSSIAIIIMFLLLILISDQRLLWHDLCTMRTNLTARWQ